jgi:multisubunit Na+/H+ antiporter MnhC subunit
VPELDPIASLSLEPGERVLWEGRPALGESWRQAVPVARTVVLVWLAGLALMSAVAGFLILRAGAWHEVLPGLWRWSSVWTSIAAPVFAALVLTRVVGPYHLSLAAVSLYLPQLALGWTSTVFQQGWDGALASVSRREGCVALVLVALPLAWITLNVVWQLNLTYVVTDRRAAALRQRFGATQLLWSAPLVKDGQCQARVVIPRGATSGRGSLLVGVGHDKRELARIERPDAVLAEIERALGATVTKWEIAPRPPRADAATPAAPVGA